MRFKPALLLVAVFGLGAAAGYAVSWDRHTHLMSMATQSVAEHFELGQYSVEAEEAERQLKNPEPAVAIYALDRAVKNIEIANPKKADCVRVNYDLGRFNAKLAQLYSQTGKQYLSQKHIEKARLAFEQMGWQLNETQITGALPLIEKAGIPATMKQIGKITSSCRTKKG